MTDLELAQCMAAYRVSPEEQVRQTAFRRQLVGWWGVEPGQRILEVGCGQGDMTAALAEAVGPNGYVLAVDSADETYGSPVSLGESAAVLKNSEVGSRIDFLFGCQDVETVEGSFDAVVMANCSWYFSGAQQLAGLLFQSRTLSPRLLFSEWDLYPIHLSQLGHFLAVQYAQLCGAHYASAELNIRNALSRDQIRALVRAAGWSITNENVFDLPELADGRWEIEMSLDAADQMGADNRLSSLVNAIRANRHFGDSLPIFSLVAERQTEA